MTLDSVFRIGSMTKAITGTAAMQLVEKGRLGLEQPMGDVLSLVRDVKVLEGFDGSDHHHTIAESAFKDRLTNICGACAEHAETSRW